MQKEIKISDLKKHHKSYPNEKIDKNKFINFLTNFKDYILRIDNASQIDEFEEHCKNIFRDFWNNSYGSSNITMNTSRRVDNAILNNNKVETIFEFKRFSNSSEMISENNINKKSLHEALSYFYKEKYNGNLTVKNLVVSDTQDFYIFETKNVEYKKIENACNNFFEKETSFDKTAQLYDTIKKIMDDDSVEFDYIHFNINDYQKYIKSVNINDIDFSDDKVKKLIRLYKILHTDFIIKQYNPKDSNELNKKFYTELLYILGLEEYKQGTSIYIRPNKVNGGIINEVIRTLPVETNISENKVEQTSFELITTWLNRILFLKLFESQLISFNDSKEYKFITSDKIDNFDCLNSMFFEVLGTEFENRSDKATEKIPYLNSSLFEVSEVEKLSLRISNLKDTLEIPVFKNSVLKNHSAYKNKTAVNTLKYLLDFLDSYDFATTNDNELIRDEKAEIINSAVLGLIFEKLNGYKDGSFYTPGYITEYMAKESINNAVIQGFNKELNIECKTILDLKNYIGKVYKKEDFVKYNNVIDNLKICDPAVGSGHFLVSVLNHIISVKSDLGILWDGKAEKLSAVVSVENDTLVIYENENMGSVYHYKRNDKSTHFIQQVIFNEKKKIIEDCLFAVDINPNSVYICQLRLWIELLKNTYYHADATMEILPNIDINVKCGNSLISKYPVKVGKSILEDMDNRTKFSDLIKDYKQSVINYKHSKSKDVKKEVNDKLKQIKYAIESVCQLDLFKNTKDEHSLYKGSMEWLIEFPELLNNNGEFMGFDVVIGNPPYLFARDSAEKGFTATSKKHFKKTYKVAEYQLNLYPLFMELAELLMKEKGQFAFITPNNFLTLNTDSVIRRHILEKSNIQITNFLSSVFESANVDTAITIYSNNKGNNNIKIQEYITNFVEIKNCTTDVFLNNDNHIINIDALKNPETFAILNKIEKVSHNLSAIADVKAGLQAYEKGKGNPKQTTEMKMNRVYHSLYKQDDTYIKYLDGKDVARYCLGWSKEYLKFGNNLASPRTEVGLYNTPRILVRQIPSPLPYCINALFTAEHILNDRNSMNIINITENPFFVLAILNSKLISYWFAYKFGKLQRGIFPQFKLNELKIFPIVKSASQNDKQKIAELAKQCQTLKQQGQQISQQEKQIDEIVYKLYNLKPAEIEIIENNK